MLFMDIWTWEPEKRDEVEKKKFFWQPTITGPTLLTVSLFL